MKIPLFFNNTARSARAGRFRRWLKRYGSVFDVMEPESSEDMLNRLAAQARSGAPAVAVAGGDGTLRLAAAPLAIRIRPWPSSLRERPTFFPVKWDSDRISTTPCTC